MKKNYLGSGFLALSLLLAYPCENRSTNTITPTASTQDAFAIAANTAAIKIVKNSFDPLGRYNEVVTYAQFIDALKLFNAEFAKFYTTSDGLFECVQANLDSFPTAIREIFENTTVKDFDIIVRERKALEYFFKNFLNCSVTQVPTWKTLSENIIPLLKDNKMLEPFRNALKETKDASGSVFGKRKIKNALDNPEVRKCIPKPIINKLESIKSELVSRVKC